MDKLIQELPWAAQSEGWIHGFLHEMNAEQCCSEFRVALSKIGIPFLIFEMRYKNSGPWHYGDCESPKPKKKFDEVVASMPSNSILVWIDQRLPMYSKTRCAPFGYIGLPHYDAHRFYMAVLFFCAADFVPSKSELVRGEKTETVCSEIATAYNTHWPKRAPKAFVGLGNIANFKIMPGNDYRNKTAYHGAYPRTLMERYEAIMHGRPLQKVLHLFSGSLPPSPKYIRVDAFVDGVEVKDYAHRLSFHFEEDSIDVIYADPPYSLGDMNKYQEINNAAVTAGAFERSLVLMECFKVMKPGALLFWLDCVSAQHLRCEKLTVVGYMSVIRSTNHRFRMVTIFAKPHQ